MAQVWTSKLPECFSFLCPSKDLLDLNNFPQSWHVNFSSKVWVFTRWVFKYLFSSKVWLQTWHSSTLVMVRLLTVFVFSVLEYLTENWVSKEFTFFKNGRPFLMIFQSFAVPSEIAFNYLLLKGFFFLICGHFGQ